MKKSHPDAGGSLSLRKNKKGGELMLQISSVMKNKKRKYRFTIFRIKKKNEEKVWRVKKIFDGGVNKM